MIIRMQQKWVYEALITHEKDVKGFIAYAFYKKSKHDIALAARAEGKAEADIRKAVQSHHDGVVKSAQLLDGFKRHADSFLQEISQVIYSEVERKLTLEVQDKQKANERKIAALIAEIESLKKDAKKNTEKAVAAEIKKIKAAASAYKPDGKVIKALCWLWNGFSGVVAGVLTAVIVGGLFVMFSTPETRTQVQQEAVTKIVGALLPDN